MRQYMVTLTGKSPLLMHWDNIPWGEELKRWRNEPENKKLSVAGDDRSPAFSWLGSVYTDGTRVAMPADNLMRCLMEGGASVVVPGGKNGKTFKAQTQSGMVAHEEFWPLCVGGNEIAMDPILKLRAEPDFAAHERAVGALGFLLYIKRARIGQSKHVRVRPRFDRWTAAGTIDVWDEQITERLLIDILRMAGEYKGLGDWRPSSPKSPGPFGRFAATVKEI